MSGARRVREIAAVPGRVEGDVVEIEPIFLTRGDLLVRADGFPPHVERFERVGIDVRGLLTRQPSGNTPVDPPVVRAPTSGGG